MYLKLSRCLLAAVLLTPAFPGLAAQNESAPSVETGIGAVRDLALAIGDPQLQALVLETLERNPDLARLAARARAAAARAPQVGGLPDPVLGATAWIDGPETRTGPQVFTLNLMQPLPWLGKLDTAEQAAILDARTHHAEVEVRRLELVTAVRRLYHELAFLVRQKEISEDFLDHLRQHENISQSRYATGTGSSQDVVKIQAEITLAEKILLDVDQRRVALEAEINALRDLPPAAVVLPPVLPSGSRVELDYRWLTDQAHRLRPEVEAAEARIAGSQMKSLQVEKRYRPDFGIGLTYTFVDERRDTAGRLLPPEGNGDDIFGVQAAVTIPVWRQKLRGGTTEAMELEIAAQEAKRLVLASIDAALGDLLQRIPLTWRELRLLEDVLILQAEESVRSAQSGYVSGSLNALDLLDAEHVFFDAETAIARARADYAIHLAELEGTSVTPVRYSTPQESEGP